LKLQLAHFLDENTSLLLDHNLVSYFITLTASSITDVAVTKFCRPYLLTYVSGSTDYINAVFADVSA